MSESTVYINTMMAIRPDVLGHDLPLAYRLWCLYFGVPLTDRTETLNHGYPIDILDPLDHVVHSLRDFHAPLDPADSLSALCLQRAREILQRARQEQREIHVLWSGGIDSTAVAVALLRESDPVQDQLKFLYSNESVWEYRGFYKEVLKKQERSRFSSIAEILGSTALIVTGEHGDQIFGSMKALKIPWKQLNQPWQTAFPGHLRACLGSHYRADAILNYLSPQFDQSPVPLNCFLDLLWWINFSMKWQNVAYRIPAQLRRPSGAMSENVNMPANVVEQLSLTEHFFRTTEFQRWALLHRDSTIEAGDWRSYKLPLKQFIFDFNQDHRYLKKKQKVPSLNQVLTTGGAQGAMAILGSGQKLTQPKDTSLREAITGYEIENSSSKNEKGFTFSYSREKTLWNEIESGGE